MGKPVRGSRSGLTAEFERVIQARHHDPFRVLGYHPSDSGLRIRTLMPRVRAVSILMGAREYPMARLGASDLFEWSGIGVEATHPYRFRFTDDHGHCRECYDPYGFAAQIPDYDLHLFSEGRNLQLYRVLGAHPYCVDGIEGTLFATWAPNAARVSVVGDFNQWDGRCHAMRSRGRSGVWELFIPELGAGELYKFEILNRDSGEALLKADPFARQCQAAPNTASVTLGESRHDWQDTFWMQARRGDHWQSAAVSLYEVHLGSWRRGDQGQFLDYRALAEQLIPYVIELGFTHLELLPIMEHPFHGSWGYQAVGYFAPTGRYGDPDGLRYFIDQCHQQGLGVILDWVPAHFPRDDHALARFDGSALYEHSDPRRGEHRDWDTLIFNYGRNEVRNFLLASALFWLREFHFDGLRVDAVASMLYLDYSREPGEWLPNIYGERENLEAVAFLKELNAMVASEVPGALVFAEESTAWPQVTQAPERGGLGFSMKWNMGWMNDTLSYFRKDPVHRSFHHDQLTFSLLYAFSERFVLPLSHDEVVHGKGSLLGKMPGDDWQRFANLRLLLSYQYLHPGKKLLFMGTELAPWREWDHDGELDWSMLQYDRHAGVQRLVTDLNRLYREHSALHQFDFDWRGFEWLDCHDYSQSVISFLRRSATETCVVVLNFTAVVRYNYRVGVPLGGYYQELLNSDGTCYGGSGVGNAGGVEAEPEPYMGKTCSLSLTLPPLGVLVLRGPKG